MAEKGLPSSLDLALTGAKGLSFDVPAENEQQIAKQREITAQRRKESEQMPELSAVPQMAGAGNGKIPYMSEFTSAAQRYGVPVNVLMGLAQQESRFNPTALGTQTKWGRAKGLMQYLDSTAAGMGINPYDPAQSIDAAARQLRQRLDKGYSMIDAVREHFAGPDRKQWGEKTHNYGVEVMQRAARFGNVPPADSGQSQAAAQQAHQAAQQNIPDPNRFKPLTADQIARLDQAKKDGADEVVLQIGMKPVQIAGAKKKDPFVTEKNKDANFLTDTGNLLLSGVNKLAQSSQELANRMPMTKPLVMALDKIDQYFTGKSSAQIFEEADKQIASKMSAPTAKARQKLWVVEPGDKLEDGTVAKSWGVGPAWKDPRAYYAGIVESVPEMAVSMGGSLSLAKGAYTAALKTGASKEVASKAAARTATIAGSILEGGLGGSSSAVEVRKKVNELPDNVLQQSAAVKELMDSGMTLAQAKKEIAESASTKAFILAGIGTGVFGGLGDRAIAKIITEGSGSRIKSMLSGAVAEGVFEEMPQSAAQQMGENYAVQGADPNQRLMEGVANQAAGGLAIGAAMGGGIGGATHRSPQSQQTQDEPVQIPEEQPGQQIIDVQPEQLQPERKVGTIERALGGEQSLDAAIDAELAAVQNRNSMEQWLGEPGAVVQISPKEDPESTYTVKIEGYQNGDVFARDQDGTPIQFGQSDIVSATPVSNADTAPQSVTEDIQLEQPNIPQIDSLEVEAPKADLTAPNTQIKAEQVDIAQPVKPAEVKQEERQLSDMTEAELRDRMKYLAQQAKTNNGWDKRLMAERRKVEAEINRKGRENTAKPDDYISGSVKWDSMSPAERMAAAEKAGVSIDKVKKLSETAWGMLDQGSLEKLAVSMRKVKPVKTKAPEVKQPEAKKSEADAVPEKTSKVDATGSAAPFRQLIIDAHINNPPMKAQIIADEVKAGRPRNEVLREVQSIVSDINSGNITAPAAQAPVNKTVIEGKDLGDGWSEFSKESGSIGIPRADMPQIKAEHRGPMVNFMNARDIAHNEETVPADSLKPTQAEFSREKVEKAKNREGGDRSILVSKDNHVLDGHHQWMAAREKGEDVKIIRLDAPITDLIDAAHEFPSSTVDDSQPAQTVTKTETPKARRKQTANQSKNALNLAIGDKVTLPETKSAQGQVTPAQTLEVTGLNGDDISLTASNGSRDLQSAKFLKRRYGSDLVIEKAENSSEKPKTEAKEKPAVTENTVFTEDAAEKARELLRKKLSQLNVGIDPEIMQAGITLAGYHIEKGARTFTAYAKAMLSDLGDSIKPYLKSWYMGVKYDPRASAFDGMSSAAEVESFDIDSINAAETPAEAPKAEPKKAPAKKGEPLAWEKTNGKEEWTASNGMIITDESFDYKGGAKIDAFNLYRNKDDQASGDYIITKESLKKAQIEADSYANEYQKKTKSNLQDAQDSQGEETQNIDLTIDEQIKALDEQINANPRPKLLERARLRKERDALIEQRDGPKPAAIPKPILTKEEREELATQREMESIINSYDRLYANASVSDLEASLERLNKQIQKLHNASIGEVTNGKRSTQKAVAAGGRDRMLKERYDLEKYIKYRKSTAKDETGTRFSRADASGLSAKELADQLSNEYDGLKLGLHGSGKIITLSRIVIPDTARNAGTGTAIMQRIIDWADQNGKTIALTPSADFGGNKKRLGEFYKRFGFIDNKGRNKDFEISESMYREADTQMRRSLAQSRPEDAMQSDQVRDALISHFGKDIVSNLEKNGTLSIQNIYDAAGVEGFYQDGKVTLVAGNLKPETIVPTFLHELGGHAGFQGVLKPKAYENLILHFDDLVKAKDPIALEAKRLAERESDANVQKDEYLPYLITVAARSENQRPGLRSLLNRILSAVKAWAFEKTGVNIPLNSQDILALANRMVNAVSEKSNANAEQRFSREDLKAPNGKPSNLTPEQWQQVRTPEFKAWFGDWENDPDNASKVVDENGEPMVVYHNSIKPNLTEFHPFRSRKEITQDERNMLDTMRKNFNDGRRPPFKPGTGIWLTALKDDYKHYGPNQYTFFANIKNPIRSDNVSWKGGVADRKDIPWDGVLVDGFDEVIVGLPEQIKSATDNVGTFDASNPDIRFSRADDDLAPVSREEYDSKIKQIFGEASKLPADKLTNAMKKGGLGLIPLRPMLTELAKDIPAAKTYLRVKEKMDAMRNEWHAKVDAVAQDWLKYRIKNRAENTALMELMHESTLAQVDPSKPFESMLTFREKESFENGNLTDKKRKEILEKMDKDQQRQKEYDRLQVDYEALSPEAKGIFAQVRDAYSDMADAFDKVLLDNMEKAINVRIKKAEREYNRELERIKDEGLQGEEKDNALAAAEKQLKNAKTKISWNRKARLTQLRQQFETQRLAGPYFPLARFGDLFVTVRDAKTGEVVSFSRFEDATDQRRFEEEMKKDKNYTVEVGALSDAAEARKAVDPNFVADVEDILADLPNAENVKDEVWQRYLASLPDMSIRKARIHRKGRAGFNADAVRAFGSQMFHGSHQLARMAYSMDLEDALDQARDDARESKDPTRSGLIVNEMEKRHQFVMSPTGGQLATWASSFAFIWYLAGSPKAAIMNLFQTPIMGVPILGAYAGGINGVARAAKQLSSAMVDFTAGKGFAEKSKRLTDDERDAMQKGYETGIIEKTQGHELAGVAETGVEYNPIRERVMKVISWGFHHTERLNREITFLAAYRLARAKGVPHEQAITDAGGLVWKTHFDYSNTSRPRLMHNDTMKILLVFRNFQLNMLFRLFRDVHQVMNGDSKEARREAFTQLAGITGMMMLNAGITGTWMFGIAMLMAGLFMNDGDDPEEELKKAMVKTLGPNLAGLALYGVPGHLTGTALSESAGMPDLWFRSPDSEKEGEEAFNFWMTQLLGAVPSIAQTELRGLDYIKKGETYRGIETMLPKMLKDPMKAYRYSTDGAKNMKGDTVADVEWQDVVKQALGFTPARISEQYKINNLNYNKQSFIQKGRKELLDAYYKAYKADDAEAMTELDQRIDMFNEKNPDAVISGKNIIASMKSREKGAESAVGGIRYAKKTSERILEDQAPSIYK